MVFVPANYSITKDIDINTNDDLSEFNLSVQLLIDLEESTINYIEDSSSENNFYTSDESIRIGSPTIGFFNHQPFVLEDGPQFNNYYYHELGTIIYTDNKGIADSEIRITIPEDSDLEWADPNYGGISDPIPTSVGNGTIAFDSYGNKNRNI